MTDYDVYNNFCNEQELIQRNSPEAVIEYFSSKGLLCEKWESQDIDAEYLLHTMAFSGNYDDFVEAGSDVVATLGAVDRLVQTKDGLIDLGYIREDIIAIDFSEEFEV